MFCDILVLPRTRQQLGQNCRHMFGEIISLVVLSVGMPASSGTMALSSIVSLESV